ncbi:histidinol-phosphate transaminase [Ectothiorhodospiraceae bacterium BW-2]|nr:histidinol-phosphate transaminase [Ectothiorhodospiraceae bacterium BW-2]
MALDFRAKAVAAVQRLTPYLPGKPIEELQRELGLERVVKLASNENPLGPSPSAKTAMAAQLEECWLYPDGSGYRLKQRLAAHHGVQLAQITLGNGSSEPLEFILRALVNQGDEVIYSQHAFALYPLLTLAVGGRGIAVPAREYGHDLAAMADSVGPKTRLIFIANPNNPTGTWLPSRTIYAFMKQLPEEVVVVIDEAYFEYAHSLRPQEIADSSQWLGEFPNLMVTRTFSKAHGLAGLRCGYSLSSPELADLMNRLRPPFNVNSLALAAAAASIENVSHIERAVRLNQQGLDYLSESFNAMGIDFIDSIGNFITFRAPIDAAKLYQKLLQQGVIVRPVANYELPDSLRVSVGLEEENQLFIEALRQSLSA